MDTFLNNASYNTHTLTTSWGQLESSEHREKFQAGNGVRIITRVQAVYTQL